MPKIVPFDQFNVPYAVGLCEELHGLGSYNHIAFDRAHNYGVCANAATSQDWFCRIAQDDEGIYTGFVAGYVSPFVFSPKLLAVESAWYVRKGSQMRTRVAVQLMRQFVDWAINDRKAVHVQTGDVAHIDSLAVDALYRHLGFQRAGTIYKYSKAA